MASPLQWHLIWNAQGFIHYRKGTVIGHNVWLMMQVEGSLTFTDNAGEGFKIFGRGTEWESIKGGKTATQAAEEAEIFKVLLSQHAAAMPEGLEADLFARELAKYFPDTPPPEGGVPVDPNAPPADPAADAPPPG